MQWRSQNFNIDVVKRTVKYEIIKKEIYFLKILEVLIEQKKNITNKPQKR